MNYPHAVRDSITMPSHLTICPLSDYGIYVATRLGAHNNQIKDDYGDDPAYKGSYYLSRKRSFDIANTTQRLLVKVVQDLGVERLRQQG